MDIKAAFLCCLGRFTFIHLLRSGVKGLYENERNVFVDLLMLHSTGIIEWKIMLKTGTKKSTVLSSTGRTQAVI